MLPKNIQFLLNIFSYCTFQIFRDHTTDLFTSQSLSYHLISSPINPYTLENLEDRSFINHHYFLVKRTHYQANSTSVWQSFKSQLRSCRILLVDFNSISEDFWIDKEGQLGSHWKSWITHALLNGLGGFRELPSYIIFEDFNFFPNSPHVSLFRHRSHTYSIGSPDIWLTQSETLLFCKSCTTEFISLSKEHTKSLRELHLYWKEICILPPLFTQEDEGCLKLSALQMEGGTIPCIMPVCM